MNWHKRFIERLHEICTRDDRASLARLRRSLDREVQSFAGAAQVIARSLPRDLPRWEEDDAYLLAGLFALAPSTSGKPLAAALRRVAQVSVSTSIELRFTSLLSAGREDLTTHLRHAVTLVRGAGIDLDWKSLFADIRRWGHPEGYTQKHWASQFWGSADENDSTSNTTEGSTS